MRLGLYESFEHLEECLTIEELVQIIEADRDAEYRSFRFSASLKGIDLDAEQSKGQPSKFQEIQDRVAAEAAGMSEETYKLSKVGISVELEEE